MQLGRHILCLTCVLAGCAEREDSSFDASLDPTVLDQAEDAHVEPDASDAEVPWTPPALAFPSESSDEVLWLSQVGLYRDIASKTIAPDLIAFEPRYLLWSDGAEKQRWLRLPPGATIDNSDPDHWQFPVGTVLFKEFSRAGKRLETRVIARVGSAADAVFMGAFVWQHDEQDALFVRAGERDVRGTDHDVPAQDKCGKCHAGEPGRVLGFSQLQVPEVAPELLSQAATSYTIPGGLERARGLGYLHANCGHCHNPNGSARRDTPMNLRLSVSDLGASGIERETVGVRLYRFSATDLTFRVLAGQPEQSGLLLRMSQRGNDSAMPPIASKHVDTLGMSYVRAWIEGLSPSVDAGYAGGTR